MLDTSHEKVDRHHERVNGAQAVEVSGLTRSKLFDTTIDQCKEFDVKEIQMIV